MGGYVKQGMSHLNVMIILKMNIQPLDMRTFGFSARDEEIGLKNYNVIAFGERKFYLPLNACTVSYLDDLLRIVFNENNDAYGIVNGIRCYEVIRYNKKTDTVTTRVKEYIYNGIQCMEPQIVSFKYEDQKICLLEKNDQEVIPWRHYDELASAFLSEHPQIDARIGKFLRNHPECFGNSKRSDSMLNYVDAWEKLHDQLTTPKTSKGVVKPDFMEEDVFQLFIKENPGL